MSRIVSLAKGSPDHQGEPFVGYVRVSTMREEAISPEIQRTAINDWARRTGNHIKYWIEDLDVSGRHFDRSVLEAIEHVEAGRAAGVAVWRYSRFGRNRKGNALSIARLEEAGGHLESATETADVTTAIGRFQRGMMLEFAAFESERIGEAWVETHSHRRARGLPAMGGNRFGYLWHRRWDPATQTLQDERYEPDPDSGPDIAEAYQRYVRGTGFVRLAAWLNSLGHRTTRGHLWSQSNLATYMDSGFPAGYLRVHNDDCTCKAQVRCGKWHLIPGAHPALISEQTWKDYRARREQVKALPPRHRTPVYALSGLMRHGECRHDLTVTSGRLASGAQRGYFYRCNQHNKTGGSSCSGVYITRAAAEEAVLEWLAKEAAEGVDNAPPAPPVSGSGFGEDRAARAARERARLEAELRRIDEALTRLAVDNARDPDKYPDGVYEAARDALTAERGPVLRALEELVVEPGEPSRGEVQSVIVGLVEEWPTLPVGDQNVILRRLVRRVVVDRVAVPGRKRGRPVVVVHPVWEPDPWG